MLKGAGTGYGDRGSVGASPFRGLAAFVDQELFR